MLKTPAFVPGVAAAVAVAAAAYACGVWLPIVGAPVFGIVFGLLLGALVPGLHSVKLERGYGFASSKVLQASVVVLGAGLSLKQVFAVGGASLPVMLGTLAVALGGAWVIGRRLHLRPDIVALIGVGTGICGASAIAAATSVLKPKQSDVAYAIGTIFTFNIAAVLIFPPLGHVLGMGGHAFGLWAGTAVNDTSSVVATAYSFGEGAGPYAVVVKLTRALMIIPVATGLAYLGARRRGERTAAVPLRSIFPTFIALFLVAAALRTIGVVPAAWHAAISAIGVFCITVALAGIGLSMRPGQLRQAGGRPLLLGAILWVLVAGASLGLQALTGTI